MKALFACLAVTLLLPGCGGTSGPPTGSPCCLIVEGNADLVYHRGRLVAVDADWVVLENAAGGRSWHDREAVKGFYFPPEPAAAE